MRAGGRFNIDIYRMSGGDDSETWVTFGIEAIWGIEWFVTDHFSVTPQALFGAEFPNEDTNGDVTTFYTGFELMVTVLP